jgi:hypothetical protein
VDDEFGDNDLDNDLLAIDSSQLSDQTEAKYAEPILISSQEDQKQHSAKKELR